MALAGYSMTSAPQFIGRELGCGGKLRPPTAVRKKAVAVVEWRFRKNAFGT
jgi:hypothetical protein